MIAEGVALIREALPQGAVGAYRLQAAIAAVHDAAHDGRDRLARILGLYEPLDRAAPSPMATLSRAVATAMVHGPAAGLALFASLEHDARLARHHRLLATRAHLRELAGELEAAASDYREAASRAASLPERRHLIARASALALRRPGSLPYILYGIV